MSRVWSPDRPVWTSPDQSGLHQWSPAQGADGDEGLAGGRVEPDGLDQSEVQEAESEATTDI